MFVLYRKSNGCRTTSGHFKKYRLDLSWLRLELKHYKSLQVQPLKQPLVKEFVTVRLQLQFEYLGSFLKVVL